MQKLLAKSEITFLTFKIGKSKFDFIHYFLNIFDFSYQFALIIHHLAWKFLKNWLKAIGFPFWKFRDFIFMAMKCTKPLNESFSNMCKPSLAFSIHILNFQTDMPHKQYSSTLNSRIKVIIFRITLISIL